MKVSQQISDDSELRKVYQPEHPDADAEGYVSYPNVDVVTEMVDLIAANRAYEANATVIEAAKTQRRKGQSACCRRKRAADALAGWLERSRRK